MKIPVCTLLTYYIVCLTPSNAEGPPSHEDCFAMPQEKEDCAVSLIRWFYDSEEGICKTFLYGDCPEPGNNFSSREECWRTCKNAGKRPASTGPTKGEGGEKKGSKKGDQGGAAIRPKHKEAPKKKPGGTGHIIRKGGGEEGGRKGAKPRLRRGSCSAMPEEGDCERLNRWYYDEKRSRCRKFRDGDCEGTESLFTTKDECLDACQGKQGSPRRSCFARPEEGDCEGVDRWYYYPKKDKCRKFRDGDCEGDNTFFKTKRECLEICQGAPTTTRPENIPVHGAQKTPPESTISKKGGATEEQRGVAEAKRRREQRRKELEAKRRRPSGKPQVKANCFSRPRHGKCQEDTEKWWFDGSFRTCSRVRRGQCTSGRAFFDSCEDCMKMCNSRDVSRCEYWK